MTEMNTRERCRTCGAPVRPSVADADTAAPGSGGPYCSIHCEHYAGLQRASAQAHDEHA